MALPSISDWLRERFLRDLAIFGMVLGLEIIKAGGGIRTMKHRWLLIGQQEFFPCFSLTASREVSNSSKNPSRPSGFDIRDAQMQSCWTV